MAEILENVVKQITTLCSIEGVTALVRSIMASPLAIVLIVGFVVKFFASGPIKEVEGSLVRAINSVEDWNALMLESKASGKIVVADFFATWCPPCKTAAPHFGRMSIEYAESNAVFCKVDVDKAPKVAQANGVTSMPSFKIIKDSKEVNGMLGWNEKALVALLEKSGGVKVIQKKGK